MLHIPEYAGYAYPPRLTEVKSVPKTNPLDLDTARAKLSYNPQTGVFIWRMDASKNVKAGTIAGSVKGARMSRKTGETTRYMYIRIDNYEMPAARVAWFLHYGVWPTGNLSFKDGDTLNLRIDNLQEARFASVGYVSSDGVKSRKMSKEAQRHYGLKRYYGLSGEQYGAMVANQKGLCGICKKPETAVFNGAPKVLHVDHCHATDQIRELLCGSCNGMLGLAKDSPETLRAAADYIEKHAKATANVVTIKRPTDGR